MWVTRFIDLLLPLDLGWLAPPINQFSLPQVSDAPLGPRLWAPSPGRKGKREAGTTLPPAPLPMFTHIWPLALVPSLVLTLDLSRHLGEWGVQDATSRKEELEQCSPDSTSARLSSLLPASRPPFCIYEYQHHEDRVKIGQCT